MTPPPPTILRITDKGREKVTARVGQRANAVVKAKLEGRAGGGRVGRRQKEGKLRVAASGST